MSGSNWRLQMFPTRVWLHLHGTSRAVWDRATGSAEVDGEYQLLFGGAGGDRGG